MISSLQSTAALIFDKKSNSISMPVWHRNRIRLFVKNQALFASIVYTDIACIMFTVLAHSKAAEDPHGARQLGVASIVLSVIGLIIGIILLIITIIMVVFVGVFTATTMEVSDFHLLHSNRPSLHLTITQLTFFWATLYI